jgi:hypothetical protein
MKPTPEQIASFTTNLRNAITLLSEALPTAETYLVSHCGAWYARAATHFCRKSVRLMEQFLQIATLLDSPSAPWPTETERSNMISSAHTFVDDWPLPDENPITEKLFHVSWCFRQLIQPPPPPPDAQPVLNAEVLAAVARYREWRPTFDRAQQAEQNAIRASREASAPAHRALPHQPDPPSLLLARTHANDAIERVSPGMASRRSPEENASLAGSHLSRGLVDHWLRKPFTQVRADLERAADLMATALPNVPLHAWLYEQWQHLAIAINHPKLMSALWSLRQSDWNNDRIRPVDWLVCRIRMLDLLQRSDTDKELHELLEKLRLGLFVEKLPSELDTDLPLMRCWYHLLRAIILRDKTIFDQRLQERHELLATYWKRGGIAPVSLVDLGGLALLRTARKRDLQVGQIDRPYLPADFL